MSALATGVTFGLGVETAKWLANTGHRMIAAGRHHDWLEIESFKRARWYGDAHAPRPKKIVETNLGRHAYVSYILLMLVTQVYGPLAVHRAAG